MFDQAEKNIESEDLGYATPYLREPGDVMVKVFFVLIVGLYLATCVFLFFLGENIGKKRIGESMKKAYEVGYNDGKRLTYSPNIMKGLAK